ncbi:hypothetical protein PHLCEN_2v12521 [Hermanssonia centrifuga]|uniref:PMS1 n=1 Tax=Hermanssonia centrifuga TaxID=98765 RepID=A0A2R6NHD8_9APHY|nr:hypothetical protein PHLCEN_2v12521 [Hermanssonia centrifuga]
MQPAEDGEEDLGIDTSRLIKPIDALSAHRITSGQVVIDLQTAVKELVENSLDAGATNIEVRFREHGLESIEVVDNGSGISPPDYDAVALKHHTSKLSTTDFHSTALSSISTFGFRGEALSSLCALCASVSVTTATTNEAPKGAILELNRLGKVENKGTAARQRGTTISLKNIFSPLPVRRKEFERNVKREFGKALNLLYAYALVPCAKQDDHTGVRLTCSNQVGGRKTVHLRTDGSSTRSSISALWGPKALETVVELKLCFEFGFKFPGQIGKKKASGAASVSERSIEVKVCGWISKFAFNCGRTSTDRQFFYVNGRPCQLGKVQKAFNEVYRTFNATQVPFVIANFLVPSDSVDVNVSPDKRTIFLHGEDSFVQALKVALEDQFAPERSTYDVQDTRLAQEQKRHRNIPRNLTSSSSERQSQDPGLSQQSEDENQHNATRSTPPKQSRADDYSTLIPNATPLFFPDEDDNEEESEHGRERPPDKTIRPEDSDNSNFGTPHLLVPLGIEGRHRSSSGFDGSLEIIAAPASILSQASEEPALPLGQTDEGVASPSVVEPDITPRCSKATSSSASSFQDSPTAVHESEPGLLVPDQRAINGSARVDSFARTPASKEIALLSSRAGSFDRQQAGTSKQAQLVLSTQGASWNLKRRRDVPAGDVDRPYKRHVGGSSDNSKPVSSRPNIAEKLSFKSKLAGYARPGSQQQLDDGADGDEEDDQLEDASPRDMNVDTGATSASDSGSTEEDELSEDVILDTFVGRQNAASDSFVAPHSSKGDPIDLTDDMSVDWRASSSVTAECSSNLKAGSSRTDFLEVIRTAPMDAITLQCNLPAIAASWKLLSGFSASECSSSADAPRDPTLNRDAGILNDEDADKATEALSRVIDKADFASMVIVGQFNHGFIIARRRKQAGSHDDDGSVTRINRGVMDDLFIVDQHAADEKYNFERLQETTKIESQRLFQPMLLELAAADQLIAIDNIDVLRQNGFDVVVEEPSDNGVTQQIKLVAQPVSKTTVFDMKGGTTHGNHAPTMELSTWKAHDASPVGHRGSGKESPERQAN